MARRKHSRAPKKQAPPSGQVPATSAEPAAAPAGIPRHTGAFRPIWRWLIPLLIIGTAAVAYHNSFAGAFLFDDSHAITDNAAIRSLWPPWPIMANTSRPLVPLTFAINYRLGGLDVRGYHMANLAIHMLAGLTLFGITRRMLTSAPLRSRFGATAAWLAGAIAVVWTVHPMQTASVTYIVQRAESMMGLFFLTTLYCVIRGAASPRPQRWYAAAIGACLLGMGSKEVMAVAPLVVLLYDRLFLAPSFAEVARQRGALYVGLAATWLVLAFGLATNREFEPVVMVADLTPWRYALTQFEVVVHYLRLAAWPHPLVFDYAWPLVERPVDALPWIAIVAALLGATLYLLHRRHWAGFWGAWFFLILAPTSTFVPIADIAFEHRMYLPLAAVAVLAVLGAHAALAAAQRRLPVPEPARRGLEIGLALVAVVALTTTTVRRNDDYRSALAMWTDNVAKRPGNARAHNNLGKALVDANRPDEAVARLNEALRLRPDYADAHGNLGAALITQGRPGDAVVHLGEAVRLRPDLWRAWHNLGKALSQQGRMAEAIGSFREAVRREPDDAALRNVLGAALFAGGRLDAAIAEYRQALRIDPRYAAAEHNLGLALSRQGKVQDAIAHFARAAELDPNNPIFRNSLGAALGVTGDAAAAIAQLSAAVRLDPGYSDAHYNLAKMLESQGRTGEAAAHLATAARLKPDFAKARENPGKAQGGR